MQHPNVMKVLHDYVVSMLSNTDDVHGIDHVYRVCGNVETIIGNIEISEHDKTVVRIAALMHDIGRPIERATGVCHAAWGANTAYSMLEDTEPNANIIDEVRYAIAVHRYSSHIHPETLSAKVLQDADRLDALGAVGLIRLMNSVKENNLPIYDPSMGPAEEYKSRPSSLLIYMHEKVRSMTPDTFHTEIARSLSIERRKLILDFNKMYKEQYTEAVVASTYTQLT